VLNYAIIYCAMLCYASLHCATVLYVRKVGCKLHIVGPCHAELNCMLLNVLVLLNCMLLSVCVEECVCCVVLYVYWCLMR
jgi:hypothetical protein